MKPEDWCFASGAATGREAAFLPARSIEEMAVLPPQEVSNRLARAWFGPAEPLAQFDRLARERRELEFSYFDKVSPSRIVIDLLRLGLAADQLRAGLAEVADGAGGAELSAALQKLALRAGDLHLQFLEEFLPPLPDPQPSARLAAALLIDSAELAIGSRLAAGEESLRDWSETRVRVLTAKVALRAVRQNVPKELLRSFFFRGALLSDAVKDFLQDYREPAALALYPPGCTPGQEEEFLAVAADASKGQPFSSAVVLRYLLGYLDQERRLRRAVYGSLGKIPAGGEARLDERREARLERQAL
jgi:hypothetical protein